MPCLQPCELETEPEEKSALRTRYRLLAPEAAAAGGHKARVTAPGPAPALQPCGMCSVWAASRRGLPGGGGASPPPELLPPEEGAVSLWASHPADPIRPHQLSGPQKDAHSSSFQRLLLPCECFGLNAQLRSRVYRKLCLVERRHPVPRFKPGCVRIESSFCGFWRSPAETASLCFT